MIAIPRPESLLLDIEARQDEVLRKLDELNLRVEEAIAELTGRDSIGDETATTAAGPDAPTC